MINDEEERGQQGVTFREEGVDWNRAAWRTEARKNRHLPRGRCGLKCAPSVPLPGTHPSPSARKVWIEICRKERRSVQDWCHLPRGRCGLKYVSLSRSEELYIVTFREEGVDWNISSNCPLFYFDVTFREEGVDWNQMLPCCQWYILGHLPRGRCGLKLSSEEAMNAANTGHLPRGRCGLKSVLVYCCLILVRVTFREEGVDWNWYVKLVHEV